MLKPEQPARPTRSQAKSQRRVIAATGKTHLGTIVRRDTPGRIG
jgi:hypothetical protein